MAEVKGYTCDGGCARTTTIEGVDSLSRQGWYTTFTPQGYPTLYACSGDCLIRALQGVGVGRALREGAAS